MHSNENFQIVTLFFSKNKKALITQKIKVFGVTFQLI
jgi:hypothetical protein